MCSKRKRNQGFVFFMAFGMFAERMELTFTNVSKTSRGDMRENVSSLILNLLRLRWLLDIQEMLSRKHENRVWSFMVEAWAKVIYVISIWVIFKAVSLDDICKIVSVDRDRNDSRTLQCYKVRQMRTDEEEPAKKNKEQPMIEEENIYVGSWTTEKMFQGGEE